MLVNDIPDNCVAYLELAPASTDTDTAIVLNESISGHLVE